MKIFKVVKVFLIVIVSIIVWLLLTLLTSVISCTRDVDDMVNGPVTQSVEDVNQSIHIIVPLHVNRGLIYEDTQVCSSPKRPSFSANVLREDGQRVSYLGSCDNTECTLYVYLDGEEIPPYLYIYTKEKGECTKKRYSTLGHKGIIDYTATIEFTEALKQRFNLENVTMYDVGSTKNSGMSSYQIMGTKKVKFTYKERVPSDELQIDDKIKAKIIFE